MLKTCFFSAVWLAGQWGGGAIAASLATLLGMALKEVVDPIIQRNHFFAHPENFVLAMLRDNRYHIFDLGIHQILKVQHHQELLASIKPLH